MRTLLSQTIDKFTLQTDQLILNPFQGQIIFYVSKIFKHIILVDTSIKADYCILIHFEHSVSIIFITKK